MDSCKVLLSCLLITLFCRVAIAVETPASPSIAPSAVPTTVSPNRIDPHESFNREMFGFNVWLVNSVVNPMANLFESALPELIRQAGHNLYENMIEPEFIVTNLFIGDNHAALVSTKRFLINSTVGVAGLWDPAKQLGYQRTETEFTESLCTAGLDPGNYVVLPVVGPVSSDSAMLLTGFFAVEWYLLSHISQTLATIDLVVDISASAASLRYARDVPTSDTKDPYLMQRADYQNYLWPRCAPYIEKKLAAHQ